MKFSFFHPAILSTALIITSNSSVANAASPSSSLRSNDKPNHRVLQHAASGTFLTAVIEHSDGSTADPDPSGGLRQLKNDKGKGKGEGKGKGNGKKPDQTLNVQFADGTIYELLNIGEGWLNGKGKSKKSGIDHIKIPRGAIMSGATIDLKGADPEDTSDILFGRRDLQGVEEATRTPEQERNLAALRKRQLQTGDKTVLAVRVVASDASYVKSESQLRDDVLGTDGDPVNLKSQYKACSFDQLRFDGASDNPMTSDPGNASTGISDGVVTVQINMDVNGVSDGTIRIAVTDQLKENFGTSSENLADHVMLCLPPGTSGSWIAYAYVNSWLSVYNNLWCNYLSTQMHEVGHNLNYAHSGESQTYDDQSGMMGYSYSSDDGPIMCFNAAKSWQTGWYTSKSTIVEPTASDGTECFEQDLYGIVDYETAAAQTVLVRISDANSVNYYVTFNRQSGINSGTREAGNQVTVTRKNNGNGYGQSTLLSKLNAGGQYSFTAGGQTMFVKVGSIPNNNYAQVIISKDGESCSTSTSTPTKNPTSQPTNIPTPIPTVQPTEEPTPQPTDAPTDQPTKSPTDAPSPAPTNFPTLPSTPAPTNQPIPPTPPPTNIPTPLPTQQPTGQPTPLPTPVPTSLPTPVPTGQPTNEPTPTPPPTPCTQAEIKIDVLTDNYPGETSWTLTNNCGASPEVLNGPVFSLQKNLYSDSYCLPAAEYTFNLIDSYGDGICCGYGSGSYSVYYDGNEASVASGGEFEASESTTFGSCGPTTSAPTKSPTASPTTQSPTTSAPTKSPTKLPTLPPSAGPLLATFDPILQVPKCSVVGAPCTSGPLLNGKGNNVEPNPPNTLDTCTDGPYGSYHGDESIDMITVSAVGGGQLQVGDAAEIEAKVWAWGNGSYDTADFYYTANVNNSPSWTHIGSVNPNGGGIRTLTAQFELPDSALQAVRVNFRYSGRESSCTGGSWDDVDDLVFTVAPKGTMAAGATKPIPVSPTKPMQSSHCVAIGDNKRRCAEVPVCKWQNGRYKGCYPKN